MPSDTKPYVLSKRYESKRVLDIIASRWVPSVLHLVAVDRRGYNDLKRSIRGISDKMLTQTLRRLERDGLLEKARIGHNGTRVSYSLTPLGRVFQDQLSSISKWAQEHVLDIEIARRRARSQNTPEA